MMLLLSSKLLTKHILSSVYYRMFVLCIIYFLLTKLHGLNTEVLCMQENVSGNQPEPNWQLLYEISKNRINELEEMVDQCQTNAEFLIDRVENLQEAYEQMNELVADARMRRDNFELECRQLSQQNRELQQQVESLTKRTTEFENVQRAFSNTRK